MDDDLVEDVLAEICGEQLPGFSRAAGEPPTITGDKTREQEPGTAPEPGAGTAPEPGTEDESEAAEGCVQDAGTSPEPGTAPEPGNGNPTPPPTVAPLTHADAPVDILGITKRLQKLPGWKSDIEPLRDRMMKEARKQGMPKADAQAWTYAELDRLHPAAVATLSAPSGGGPLQGLGDIPDDWPELPDNASLPAEIGWVQAQRLRIVEDQPSGATVVHLARARSPAPSWAALGWPETSIRSYAKFVDVVAKSMATQQDEATTVRRERLRIEEMRSILAEMHED